MGFVSEPPSLILLKRLHDVVRFNCSAKGYPLLTVHWIKNGDRVPSIKVKSGLSSNVVKAELVLKHSTPNQSDIYSCVTRNAPFTEINATTKVGELLFFCVFLLF